MTKKWGTKSAHEDGNTIHSKCPSKLSKLPLYPHATSFQYRSRCYCARCCMCSTEHKKHCMHISSLMKCVCVCMQVLGFWGVRMCCRVSRSWHFKGKALT